MYLTTGTTELFLGEKMAAGKTVVVKILEEQNSTWQGTVTWVETGRTLPFRSVLELIRLMDSAVEEKQ